MSQQFQRFAHRDVVIALIARVFDGQPEGLTRDDILDNVTLYWLTNTAVSLARLYWGRKLAFVAPKHVAIPVAVSVFSDEIYAAPRSWAERAYPILISTKAGTLRLGNSHNSFQKRFAPASDRCGQAWRSRLTLAKAS